MAGAFFPHDTGLLQSMRDSSLGSFAKSSSFTMYDGFVAGGPDADEDIASPPPPGEHLGLFLRESKNSFFHFLRNEWKHRTRKNTSVS